MGRHAKANTLARISGQALASAIVAGLAVLADGRVAVCLIPPSRRGYLATVGTPPLRFQDDRSPVHPAVQPPAISSPSASPPDPPKGNHAPAAPGEAAIAATGAPPHAPAATPAEPGTGPSKTPPRLMWDVVKPTVRPEDFLPFFTTPGAAEQAPEALIIIPPQTAAETLRSAPPSSATYRQVR